ncbi:DUF2971 domain-containing protein [Azotobacter vinelandii]|uniref:DUF2971 domain-containing protein n=1 Tax=Azotobacter vinelandii TaxID=354 RepID=UPI000921FB31|nr:DUF2971 domain-containing protein [Azotobacter vinelandii]SFX44206.1 Protein of unknown function [Azotobacter vinelandii]
MPLIRKHPVFHPPISKQSLLWRYMGLPKFLSLLQSKSLFFYNLELMAQGDPFEGTLPSSRFLHRSWNAVEDVPSELKGRLSGFLKRGETDLSIGLNRMKELAELRIRQAFAMRRAYFINCWHMNDHESAAMWDIYSKRNEGIAIVSCEERLEGALENCSLDIYGGKVIYGNYSSEKFVIDENSAFTPIIHKRMSFEYEKEFRLAYCDTSVTHKEIKSEKGFFNIDGDLIPDITPNGVVTRGRSEDEIEAITPTPGVNVNCDLNILINKIYISPLAEQWFYDIVASACSTYGITAPVEKSEIFSEPMR